LKKIFNTLFILLFHLLSYNLQAQSYILQGYIKDKNTEEALIGATIYVENLKKGTITDLNGFYQITLPADSLSLKISFIGYENQFLKIKLEANQKIDFSLNPKQEKLDEVIVSADNLRNKFEANQMSVESLDMENIKTIPVIFGEADILKILQFKPGVNSGGEGSSGLYVRGGGPDQNLVLLDKALIYNATHLFGFFSVFNPDVVRGVDLYKGNFPAQFGGRLSSVVDVHLREGNKEKFGGSGGLGLISSRLTLEAPLMDKKGSFLVSGRRTYFDIFTRMINQANEGNADFSPIPDYYFYDMNAKLNYTLSPKDKLSITAYYGRDIFGFDNDNFNFDFTWGNTALTLEWQHRFNDRLFAQFRGYYTAYQYNITNRVDIFEFNLGSSIADYTAQTDFTWLPNERHEIQFGGQFTHHQFLIGRLRAGSDDGSIRFNSENVLSGNEYGAYISDNIRFNNLWQLNLGLRVSAFTNEGENYVGFEPRSSLRYQFRPNLAFKLSYARMYQYIHLVSNSGASLPTDIWYPSSKVVQPQVSDQTALGLSWLFAEGTFLLTNEIYYKSMQNQLDLKDGAQIFANPQIEEEFVFGRGWSYGNEIYLEKKEGKTRGWLGYTLSWTQRQFGESNGNPAINNGEPFFPRYDRRHDVSLVITHDFSPRVTFTLAWVFNTGNAISLPTGRYFIQEIDGGRPLVVPEFLERNGFRMPDYHRLDLGLVWKFNPKWGSSDLTFSIYNAYNRRNPYFIYFEELKDANDQTIGFRARQVTLFPIIPTITYNFKF